MKVTFLGTNGWYDTPTGNTPSVFIETPEEYIILDAGGGFYKARGLVKDERPVRLFLSHFHLDHIIGLHTLPIFKFPQGLDIYLASGQEKLLRIFLKRPFTTPLLFLPMKIRLHDIDNLRGCAFALEYAPLKHSVPCYGFRFTIEGKTVTYCTDTGICGNLKKLARGADIFMTECAIAPDEKGLSPYHLTPQLAARAAKDAVAKRLYLCHFDPGKYPSFVSRSRAEDAARAIFAQTCAAKDGMIISL